MCTPAQISVFTFRKGITWQASKQAATLAWWHSPGRPGPVANNWSLGCRHKSKQALRDYQKVLVQLENLEIGVGDQCRKEFTGGEVAVGREAEDPLRSEPTP